MATAARVCEVEAGDPECLALQDGGLLRLHPVAHSQGAHNLLLANHTQMLFCRSHLVPSLELSHWPLQYSHRPPAIKTKEEPSNVSVWLLEMRLRGILKP